MSNKTSKSKKKIYGRNRRIAIVAVLASLLVVAVGAGGRRPDMDAYETAAASPSPVLVRCL